MDGLTAFQRDLLYVIAGGDEPNGLALKRALQQYYTPEINHGRLYPNLDELAERGLVEKGKIDDRANSYTLTEEGKRALADRRAWEDQYLSTAPGTLPSAPEADD